MNIIEILSVLSTLSAPERAHSFGSLLLLCNIQSIYTNFLYLVIQIAIDKSL